MISILLPCYKSEQLLRKVFLPSLRNCSVDCEVILYDNGGNNFLVDPLDVDLSFTRPVLPRGHMDIKSIGNGENVGLNRALNECAKAAKGDYFFLPHTDMYLLPGWDTALFSAAKNQAPASFLFCSRSVEPIKGHTNHHIIKDYGKEWHTFDEKSLLADFANYKDHSVYVGARMPFFMHRKLWEKMNGVDPYYFSYATDDDLIQEVYHVGVRKFWMIYNSLVYHLVGKSNAQQVIDKDRNEPYNYFVDKWKKKGYNEVHHPGQWQPKLIPFEARIK